MAFTAKDVADLRAKTGVGMMECKKALAEANGDFEEAVKILREKGLSVAAKKADRIAAEGIVDILVSDDGNTAAIIEVNAETDFVAKNETFRTFVQGVLKTILNTRPADMAALLAEKYLDTDFTVEGKLKDMIFTIGENMNIRRFQIVDGTFSTYIHGKGTTGVIVTFDADEKAKSHEGFAEFAKNIALQIAAMPVLYLSKETVPEKDLEEEKEILRAQMNNDESLAKKPEAIKEKMIAGRITKFYEKNCLLEQSYVKDDELTVGQYVAKCEKEFGGKITVTGFICYEKGEGLQKKEEDFAAEIEKMVNK
jgi:elongation factor Ts